MYSTQTPRGKLIKRISFDSGDKEIERIEYDHFNESRLDFANRVLGINITVSSDYRLGYEEPIDYDNCGNPKVYVMGNPSMNFGYYFYEPRWSAISQEARYLLGESTTFSFTEYKYDDPSHIYETSRHLENSNGETVDFKLLDYHFGVPSQVLSLADGDTLRWRGVSYGDASSPLPDSVWVRYDDGLKRATQVFEDYNPVGIPRRITDAAGLVTLLYFGNNQLPISQQGMHGVQGKYLTGVQTVVTGTPTNSLNGQRPPGSDNYFLEARYDTRGRMVEIIDENEISSDFEYDGFGRLTQAAHDGQLLNRYEYHYSHTETNWMKAVHMRSAADSTVIKTHHDGLGRPVQTQSWGTGLTGMIVEHQFYDEAGREWGGLKPIRTSQFPSGTFIAAQQLIGSLYPDKLEGIDDGVAAQYFAQQGYDAGEYKFPFSYVEYEQNPLSRPARQVPPGLEFDYIHGLDDTTVRYAYGLNEQGETFLGYQPGQLERTTVLDENGSRTDTFTDGWGREIARVVHLDDKEQQITRFAYDLLGRLVKVYEPNSLKHKPLPPPGRPSAFTRVYQYDALDNLVSEDLSDWDAPADYFYDTAGNLRFTRGPAHQQAGSPTFAELEFGTSQQSEIIQVDSPTRLRLVVDAQAPLVWGNADSLIIEVSLDGQLYESFTYKKTAYDLGVDFDRRLAFGTGELEIQAYTLPAPNFSSGNVEVTGTPVTAAYTKYDLMGRPVQDGLYFGDITALTPSQINDPDFPQTDRRILHNYHYGQPGGQDEYNKTRLTRVDTWDWHTSGFSQNEWGYDSFGNTTRFTKTMPGNLEYTVNYTYDRQGNLLETAFQPDQSGERWHTWNEYDGLGRLRQVLTGRTGQKNQARVEARYTYDAEGRPLNKTLVPDDGPTPGALQDITYRYNIRGWLRSINNPDDLSNPISGYTDDRFALRLNYTDSETVSPYTANYNGNISEVEWRIHNSASGISSGDKPRYEYFYDRANRLVRADYYNPEESTVQAYNVNSPETSPPVQTSSGVNLTLPIRYDANGNFLLMRRYGQGPGFQLYEYTYYSGTNRLRNTDGNTDNVYTYDAAGNVISNSDRDITTIHYDQRNLAHLIATDSGFHQYSYDEAGQRTAKYYRPDNQSTWTLQTRYARGAFGEILAQYDDDQLQYWNLLAAGGETLGRMDEGDETRYYYLKDHLGSVRVTIDDDGDIVTYDDYYPFGLQMPGRSWNQGNAFDDQKFTGHFLEQEGGLGIYHAGARLYDPEVPRFYGVDAMRSEMPGWNPYQYSFNNPVRFVDPDGNQGIEAALRRTFGWLERPFYRKSKEVEQASQTLRNMDFEPQAISDIYVGTGKMVSGYYAARSDLSVANIDQMLEGAQQLFDGIAEVSGTVENVSAVATLTGSPKAATTFASSSATASVSDGISTGIEFARIFTSDDATAGSFTNRLGWTLFNNTIPGRVPSIYQGREELQKTIIKTGIKETDKVINQ